MCVWVEGGGVAPVNAEGVNFNLKFIKIPIMISYSIAFFLLNQFRYSAGAAGAAPRRGRGLEGWPGPRPRRGRGQNIWPGRRPRRGRGQNVWPGRRPRRGRGRTTWPGRTAPPGQTPGPGGRCILNTILIYLENY